MPDDDEIGRPVERAPTVARREPRQDTSSPPLATRRACDVSPHCLRNSHYTEITEDQTYLDLVARELNNRPRRILGYRTPAEVFTDLLTSSIATTG